MNAFPPEHYALEKLENQLNECLIRDRRKLYRQGNQLRRRLQMGKPILRDLAELEQAVEASKNRCVRRRDALPSPEFDSVLPINQKRGEIADALRNCQVVVLCGETGSGKTTQLPKICLELGLGAAGTIGHTQPRRIAARSVATRIAEELHSSVGGVVGYKVRFGDRTGENTIIKLMTDGILLAETQSDRYLEQYEVIIIDEAHERSLNIDFLLGYLHRLLPSRRDLKLIVTSATIDPERFSRHFHNAPIIEVSGRTYPVEIRYRPLIGDDDDERDRDSQQAILEAVDEVSSIDRGDLLIFLNGEREIRETAESLRKHHPPATEILPLFARLSAAEQNRIFQPHGRRRIVLATNVAETSLTVPGIRYVIDPGTARISRYSHRSKLQRLPIEKISQASADQRAGRCGRVSAGICIRLYGEEDFRARPPYTDPEILRTNLAAVILQMSVLGLGDVANFPFIDSPDSRLINDGFKLLYELQAVDEQHRVTDLGRQLARLPIDPRLGRMILAAHRHGSLKEVLVIGSALAIQDPRERPLEHRQAADEKHRRFYDERSDFLSLLKLWEYYHEQARKLSRSKLRSLCQQEFLSFVRMREWHDLHQELHGLVTEMGFHPNELPADYNSLHQALLTGLLGHLGARQEDRSWLGARGRKFFIFPGSGLFKKSPRWVMAAEMVETSKIYARTVANIEPEWIEPPARHLVKRSYSDPHWEKRAAQVAATERVTLYGLTIVSSRKINYGPIAPAEARTLFIRHALVRQEYHSDAPYARQQRKLIDDIEQLEAKTRRRDLLVDEDTLFRFYDERVPPDVNNGPRFERWRKQAERDDPRLLFLTRELLLNQETAPNTGEEFPDTLDFDGLRLPLSYCFMPGAEDDGVTLTVPLAVLNQLDARRLEWLVPGLLGQRIAALLKSLPKALRRHFVPVPNYVRVLLEVLVPDGRRLTEAIATYLHKITGVAIPPDAWQAEAIQDHLRMRLRVLNADGSVLVQGRDLETIKKELEGPAQKSFAALPTPEFERDDVHDWDFGDLPLQVEFERNGIRLKGYPTVLAQEDGSVALRLVDAPERAERLLKSGVRRMLIGRLRDPVRYLKRNLPGLQQMSLYFVGVGTQEELRDDLLTAILNRAFLDDGPLPRSREAFEACLTRGKPRLQSVANELCTVVREALAVYHEVRKILNEEDRPLGWSEALEDIQDQLDWLVYKGFITQTPAIWLNHLPR
ncbi:MAG: ATP-dependent RNA helicase HrpA, partial [Gammaproteobacteria bacterium]|nr:ATP-dependent RNA helicase HrpA [Gammaproteobacteria bacterium]